MFKWVLGCAVLVGLAVGVIAGNAPPSEPASARIERECENAYGLRGKSAVQNCEMQQMTRILDKAERAKMDEVTRRVGY